LSGRLYSNRLWLCPLVGGNRCLDGLEGLFDRRRYGHRFDRLGLGHDILEHQGFKVRIPAQAAEPPIGRSGTGSAHIGHPER
jgi:hypothetical protein